MPLHLRNSRRQSPLLRTVLEPGSCKRHCGPPASRTPRLEIEPSPAPVGLYSSRQWACTRRASRRGGSTEGSVFDEALWLGALAEFAEATVEEEVGGEEDGGGADDVGESLTVETSTLKLEMTRSAVPTNGSVPVCIACRYCVFATPWLFTKYSAS